MEFRNWKLWAAVACFALAVVLIIVGAASAGPAGEPVAGSTVSLGAAMPATGGAHWALLSNVKCVGSLCRGYVCASDVIGGKKVAACGWVSGRNYYNGKGVWVRLVKSGSRYVVRLDR